MSDLRAFLLARLDEDEAAARVAVPGPWTVDGGTVYATHVTDEVVRYTQDSADHIARHDPARVLREIEAKRRMLKDLQLQKHAVVEDCWYTCAAATEERDGDESCDDQRRGGPCDCGRDARVMRQLRLLAFPCADHDDYQPDWATDTEGAE